MNKTAIKNFAVSARRKLIAMAADKAGRIGIAANSIAEPSSSGSQFAIFPTGFGTQTRLDGDAVRQRASLVTHIKSDGYDAVMEEVAYTWFNRLIAVRFMEVNDYLPTRVRVLSSETAGKFEPDLVTQAPNVELGFTEAEKEEIYALKDKPEKSGDLFRMLFVRQCNALGTILPELFEKTADYTELLLDLSWDKPDGVIRDLLSIDEADFREAVEIVGWLYQYYNTEPKDETFALLKKNVKITKERIPSATQLFTPDWIVRYMVENSLGRLWLEGHPDTTLKADWKYYLDEAEQEENVKLELEKIRADYKNIKLEEIKLIDPCMGSGHILVYAFDVLMQIYLSCGYTKEDAAALIVEKNLYGVDIDKRAYQMAYFALNMKGRSYDRRFLTRAVVPQVYYPAGCPDGEEYGSLLLVDKLEPKPDPQVGQMSLDDMHDAEKLNAWNFRRLLSQQYDVVVTNPPYMGSSGMGGKLNDYVKKNYPDSKADLFACFIERCGQMTKQNCYTAMITQHAWMFLSSFEKLRAKMLLTDTVNMAHLGARAFEEIGGEVVQTTTWVQRNSNIANYQATYARLVDYNSQQGKEAAFLAHSDLHTAVKENFEKIPGAPIAYWLSDATFQAFVDASFIKDWVTASVGIQTGDNDKFLHFWWEISFSEIFFNAMTVENTYQAKRWFPYNKGGGYRKWYGNDEIVVDWRNDGESIKRNSLCTGHHYQQYADDLKFQPMVTWSRISSGSPAFRFKGNGYLSDMAGFSLYSLKLDLYILIAFCNSAVAKHFLEFLAPTLNFMINPIISMPLHINQECSTALTEKVAKNLTASKTDWDSFETSWDFEKHPLIRESTVQMAFAVWQQECDDRFNTLKANEEELNRIFIDIYGLQDELTPEVADKDVTVRRADLAREIRSFISYAVGCMFGRYSLDVEGLAYAGGDWDVGKYTRFLPDRDNVLPITDEAYFPDDIVTRFIEFVKTVYGGETLEENLDFIARALGNKGDSARQVIRNYFLRDFYKDHCKIYQKRPIYWLFDSGKEDGFKALIYLHRYDPDTVGRVRADYLHKQQGFLENAVQSCDYTLENSENARDKADATKKKDKLVRQLAETRLYDQALAHIALQRIPLDLDDGVKVNYEKFQGIEVKNEGTKAVKIDLLGKI